MSRLSVTRIVGLVLVAVIAAAGWLLLGPAQLGGPARYAIIDGTSMMPALADGDLAIVRVDGEPEKGEIVLYHDPRLEVDVLHRIERELDSGRFVLKGDNNDYLDDARPTAAELGGTLWFSVPYLGAGVEWLREPLHAAIVVFVLFALAFAGSGGAVRRRGGRARETVGFVSPGVQLDGALRGVLTAACVAAALFGLLALVAFSRSVSRAETVEEARVHQGTLSYSAEVEASDVYPEGTVRTGETAFLQLVPALDVSFAYRYDAEESQNVRGEAGISAVVSDGAGWAREVAVAPMHSFIGSRTTVTGTLDLAELAEIVDEVKTLTGSLTTTFAVRIAPTVSLSGRVGSDAVRETFAPQMPFLLDDVSLRVDAPADGSAPLSERKTEPGTIDVPSRLALGTFGLAVDQARKLAIVGLASSLLLLAMSALAVGVGRVEGEHGRIASLFGDRLISIARPPSVDAQRLTDVGDFESLARVAEIHDRIVLHWRRGDAHVYLVDDGAAAYRYTSGPSTAHAVSADLEDTLVLPG